MGYIVGKYEYYKSQNCNEFFAATVPNARGQMMGEMKASMEVKHHGDENVFEIIHRIPDKTIHTVFKIGVPFLDEVPTGNIFQSVASLEDNVLKIQSTFEGKDYGGRSLAFTKDDLTVTIYVPHMTKVSAIRYYKRIN